MPSGFGRGLRPPQLRQDALHDAVGSAHMPVVVESPYNHMVLANKLLLFLPYRVVRILELRRFIEVAVERRFVGDDSIPASAAARRRTS